MRLHPATILGVVISLAGWVWLVFFVSVSPRFGDPAVVNLHLMTLAQQVCLLGYVLVVIGILIGGFEWLVETTAVRHPTVTASAPQPSRAYNPAEADGLTPLQRLERSGYRPKDV